METWSSVGLWWDPLLVIAASRDMTSVMTSKESVKTMDSGLETSHNVFVSIL